MENKPIFSKSVSAGSRVYYVDVNVDRKGQKYMAITEIPTGKAAQKKKRQRVFVHAENIDRFAQAFAEVSGFIKNETKG